MGGSAPKAPPPLDIPPPASSELNPLILEERRRARQRGRTLGGRQSTILTSPTGDPAGSALLGVKTLIGQQRASTTPRPTITGRRRVAPPLPAGSRPSLGGA